LSPGRAERGRLVERDPDRDEQHGPVARTASRIFVVRLNNKNGAKKNGAKEKKKNNFLTTNNFTLFVSLNAVIPQKRLCHILSGKR
jgi:hypothetical protein